MLDTFLEAVAARLCKPEGPFLEMERGGSFCNHPVVICVLFAEAYGGVEEARMGDRVEMGTTDRCVVGEQAAARCGGGGGARGGIGCGRAAAIEQEAW